MFEERRVKPDCFYLAYQVDETFERHVWQRCCDKNNKRRSDISEIRRADSRDQPGHTGKNSRGPCWGPRPSCLYGGNAGHLIVMIHCADTFSGTIVTSRGLLTSANTYSVGLIAQLVRPLHWYSSVVGSNPIQTWIFFLMQWSFPDCKIVYEQGITRQAW